MDTYIKTVEAELRSWQKQMMRKPSVLNYLSKRIQAKINS
jgi:hypothetical protein